MLEVSIDSYRFPNMEVENNHLFGIWIVIRHRDHISVLCSVRLGLSVFLPIDQIDQLQARPNTPRVVLFCLFCHISVSCRMTADRMLQYNNYVG